VSDSSIDDLLEPTPLTIARLKRVWNYLPLDSKTRVIKSLLNTEDKYKPKLKYWHQVNQLHELGLNDENPYIRYLVAETISKPFKWKGRKETERDRIEESKYQRVLADENELVRSVAEEGLKGFPNADEKTADFFWNLSPAKRLMSISSEDSFDRLKGDVVAKILEFAAFKLLPEKKISSEEIIDVIQQYLAGDSIKKHVRSTEEYAREFIDGFAEYSLGKEIEALWQVAIALPDEVGFDLIEMLPVSAGLFVKEIPIEGIEKISKYKLRQLFYRDDVGLNEFRRQSYSLPENSENSHLRSAAVCSMSFVLKDSDFRNLEIKKDDSKEEGKRKFEELKLLAEWCRGATLAQMEAIIDLIQKVPDDYFPGLSHSGELIAFARRNQEYRAKHLGHKFSQELLDWRIYALASYLVGGYAPDCYYFLKSDTVHDDRWATYLKISSQIKKKTKLHKDLPVLELDGVTYPSEAEASEGNQTGVSTENLGGSKETTHENLKSAVPIKYVNLEPQLAAVETKIKWMFWLLVLILALAVSHH